MEARAWTLSFGRRRPPDGRRKQPGRSPRPPPADRPQPAHSEIDQSLHQFANGSIDDFLQFINKVLTGTLLGTHLAGSTILAERNKTTLSIMKT